MDPSLQWVNIEDFTPGIRHSVSPGHPIGSATQLNTWGCHANEMRGLVPGPKPVRTWSFNPETVLGDAPEDLVSECYRIGGLFCNDPVYQAGNTLTGPDQNNSEVYVGFEWWTSGTQHLAVARLRRHQISPTWQVVHEGTYSKSFDPLSRPKRCYFASGRSNNADSTQVGPIVVGWVYGGQAKFFPDDTAPTALGVVALPGESETLVSPDTMIGHQGRALIFPLSLTGMGAADTVTVTNECLYYSAVNDWRTLETELDGLYFNIVAGYENPTGYGVIASNDASELLLIKARGGAILIRGDLNNFSAQTLPNVRGTGQSLDIGTHSPIGYMYPIDAGQVEIWTGGDNTTNAAPFLAEDFFRVHNADLDDNAVGWGYHFTQSTHWGNLVMFGNNWFCDTDVAAPEGVPSWWKLDDRDDYRFCKYTVDWKGRHMYAAQMGIRGQDDPVLVEYDNRKKRANYSWQSHPLPFTIDAADISDLREIAVTAIGKGRVTVTVTSDREPVGKSQVFEFTSDNSDTPEGRYAERQVRPLSVQGSHHQIRLEVEALNEDDAAPQIAVPLALGFKPGPHIPRSM